MKWRGPAQNDPTACATATHKVISDNELYHTTELRCDLVVWVVVNEVA